MATLWRAPWELSGSTSGAFWEVGQGNSCREAGYHFGIGLESTLGVFWERVWDMPGRVFGEHFGSKNWGAPGIRDTSRHFREQFATIRDIIRGRDKHDVG